MESALGTSPTKRRNMDLMKLMMSDYKVEHLQEDGSSFDVVFHGPKDTAYAGGTWKVHVSLPLEYPYRSPSIGFRSGIYHPNVDERSGSVCLDVINQTWSPMFDLVNIFDVFLPQLLTYPNPRDPLNSEAASLLLNDPEKYEATVKRYVVDYAGENKTANTSLNASPVGDFSNATETDGTSNEVLQTSACSTDISGDDSADEMSSLGDASDDGEFDLDI